MIICGQELMAYTCVVYEYRGRYSRPLGNHTPLTQKKNSHKRCPLWLFRLVDARGIEPLSENLLIQLSPGAENLLKFLFTAADYQASCENIVLVHGLLKRKRQTHVHR